MLNSMSNEQEQSLIPNFPTAHRSVFKRQQVKSLVPFTSLSCLPTLSLLFLLCLHSVQSMDGFQPFGGQPYPKATPLPC